MRLFALLLTGLFALPAFAQDDGKAPMTGAEFQAYSEGKTLGFLENGMRYGTEEYLRNRRVRWAFTADECREGYWFESGPEICFVYEDRLNPQCWLFFDRGGRVTAIFAGDPERGEIYEAYESKEPLICLGPKIGV